MHDLICRCPKAQQPIDLQLYTDGVSLALMWSNPVRFQCPHCGTEHETKVGEAHLGRSLAARQGIAQAFNTSAGRGRSQRTTRRQVAP
jgi:hypothetical protein